MGHTVTCDNRFSTTMLFEYLYDKQNTCAVGSLRWNTAGMPDDYSKLMKAMKNSERGEYKLRQNGRLLFTAWKDTAVVGLLSTAVDPKAPPGEVLRQSKKEVRKVACPASALAYNLGYNWVDISNHLMSSFYVGRRCKYWHRYFFFHKLNQGE